MKIRLFLIIFVFFIWVFIFPQEIKAQQTCATIISVNSDKTSIQSLDTFRCNVDVESKDTIKQSITCQLSINGNISYQFCNKDISNPNQTNTSNFICSVPILDFQDKVELVAFDFSTGCEVSSSKKIALRTENSEVTTLSSDSDDEILIRVLKRLFFCFVFRDCSSGDVEEDTTQPSPTPSLGPIEPITPFPTPPPDDGRYKSLSTIFSEAGKNVGVPPSILKGIMLIESRSTFNLAPGEISSASVPGGRLFWCPKNFCSAQGPMQFTTGRGPLFPIPDPFCLLCPARYCPNAWGAHGTAVNIYGGSTVESTPCNIRDSIYAAAKKLKNDSGAADPLNWTREQVYEAARRYYGSCTKAYNRECVNENKNVVYKASGTYCELLWTFYTKPC